MSRGVLFIQEQILKAEFKNRSRNANEKYYESLERVSLISVKLPYIEGEYKGGGVFGTWCHV
jgi:hypothetical protein